MRALAMGLVIALAPAAPAAAADGQLMPVIPMVAPVIAMVTPEQDVGGIATVEEKGRTVDVRLDSNVLFAKDSDVIRPAASARIRQVALTLRAKGKGAVRIDGYTDDLGSAQHGLDLSRRRAAAVAARLRPFLPAAQYRFTVRGLGEANFVVPNTSEPNRRKNRRVEVHFAAG